MLIGPWVHKYVFIYNPNSGVEERELYFVVIDSNILVYETFRVQVCMKCV